MQIVLSVLIILELPHIVLCSLRLQALPAVHLTLARRLHVLQFWKHMVCSSMSVDGWSVSGVLLAEPAEEGHTARYIR